MATVKVTKSELATESTNLLNKIAYLSSSKTNLISSLQNVPDFEGINVSSTGKILIKNIETTINDLEIVATNIKNYLIAIENADTDGEDNLIVNELIYSIPYTSDGSREGNIIAIWSFLRGKGLSDNAIAGVLGNISAECSFNPAAIESNGEGHGLIQWSFGRKNRLLQAAEAKGVDWRDINFQLEFLWDESLDPNSSYGKKLAKVGFYDDISIEDAAFYFHKYVEVSADSKARIRRNRIDKAVSLYNQYLDKVNTKTTASKLVTQSGSNSVAKIEEAFSNQESTGAVTSSTGYTSVAKANITKTSTSVNTTLNKVQSIDIPSNIKQDTYGVNGYDYWLNNDNKTNWANDSSQKLVSNIWEQQGSNFSNGLATIKVNNQDRYLVSLSSTYGNIGDCVDIKLQNGTTIPCIIADSISTDNMNEYGSITSSGLTSIIEFQVEKSQYLSLGTPSTAKWNLSWDSTSPITNITNYGNITYESL